MKKNILSPDVNKLQQWSIIPERVGTRILTWIMNLSVRQHIFALGSIMALLPLSAQAESPLLSIGADGFYCLMEGFIHSTASVVVVSVLAVLVILGLIFDRLSWSMTFVNLLILGLYMSSPLVGDFVRTASGKAPIVCEWDYAPEENSHSGSTDKQANQ